jgi:hypothetical protein
LVTNSLCVALRGIEQGNVGTPLKWIQERVQECAFPSSLIKKLGIHALRRRKAYRRYGEVHFDYSSYHVLFLSLSLALRALLLSCNLN